MSQIVVLNAGGQYCHLIARRVRELGVHALVLDIATPAAALAGARGIIISGGPRSVHEPGSPRLDPGVYRLGVPVLGICYGHQLIARDLDGAVVQGVSKEYGEASLEVVGASALLGAVPAGTFTVWMSHGDTVMVPPEGFDVVGQTRDCKIAAMEDATRRLFGIQFHPEVSHTAFGREILERFVFGVAGCVRDWDPRERLGQLMRQVGEAAGDRRVFFLVSGGVDSTVAFHLCVRALSPDRVRGLFVDTGFMRKGEADAVRKALGGIPEETLHIADRSARFFQALDGVINPEDKRRIIGDLFVSVQEEEFRRLAPDGEEWLLGQGTIYPDTIESGGTKHAARIKTHHNRVDRILELIAAGKVIEPLVEFYKDEVRMIAQELGLPPEIVSRHPFPGPGLAVRCLCAGAGAAVERLDPAATGPAGPRGWLVPLRTVGVQGDERSYAPLAVIEPPGDPARAGDVSRRITNELRLVNRVAVGYAPGPGGLDGFRVHPATLTRERIGRLQEVDAIVTEVLKRSGEYDRMWQCPVGLLPLGRRGGESVMLRPVRSQDGMTAEFVRFPDDVLDELRERILGLPGVEALLCDVTNKPPATIELE
jgi:GMP synthase (glutamine-hydrolysing)